MKKIFLIITLSMLSMITFAQTDWEEYYRTHEGIPKITPELEVLLNAKEYIPNPNRKRETLPSRVDNTATPYFRPNFSQANGSCAQASGIGYCFTYEINAARGANANLKENQYPTHFTYNFLNGGIDQGSHTFDAFDIAKDLGVPTLPTYGGSINALGLTGWMSGYDKYYNAMQNRVIDYVSFPYLSMTTANIETMKRWMYNHDGKKSYGGVFVFYTDITGANIQTIPTGQYEAGKHVWLSKGTTGGHAMTLAGYDDNVGWDFNGDGQITSDEKGAFIVVNSWGSSWYDGGKVYCPYRAIMPSWNIITGSLLGINVKANYKPKLTLRVVMNCSDRSSINVIAGCSQDVNATIPAYTRSYKGFSNKYSGALPMLGTSTAAMEFGLDVSDLLEKIDPTKASKFFLRIDAGSTSVGTISDLALISYEVDETGIEYLSSQKNVPIVLSGQTFVSVVRNAFPLNPPENVFIEGLGQNLYLYWTPPVEGCLVVSGYKIYKNGALVSKFPTTGELVFLDNSPTAATASYQISALYNENGKEFESNLTKAVTLTSEVSPSTLAVDFVADLTNIEQGKVVRLTDKTTGNPSAWYWTIESDNGTAEPQNFLNQNPTVTFKKAGTYTISLSVSNSVNNSSTFKPAYITVKPITVPVADFTSNVTTINETGNAVYTDLSTQNPLGYLWHFQGGTPEYSHLANPKVIYNTSGLFETTLTVTNAEGSNSITKSNYIKVNTVTPITDFTSDLISILKGSSVKYQDLTKYTPTSLNWTFDGGTPATSTEKNPSVRYPKAGMYNVTLSTSNAAGASTKTVQRYVQVSAIDGGNSLAFDGIDDCVSVTGIFPTAPTQFTVEFWIKPASMSDWNQKIGVGWGTFLFHVDVNGSVVAGISSESTNRFVIPNAIDLNRWQHFAFTYDNKQITLYKNGEVIGVTKTVVASSGAWNNFYIGTTGAGTINGKVDEVRVWNTPRTQAQIKSLINSEIANPSAETNLILYYKFNQSASATVTDEKGTYTGIRSGYSVVGDAWVESMAFCANGDNSAPIANFEMNTNIVYQNVPVQFTDKSSDNPAIFNWSFAGANESQSTETNPLMIFANTGKQTVQLDVTYSDLKTASKQITIDVVSDTDAPSVPENLGIVGVSTTSISLSWNPAIDNVGVKGYRIYQNGVKIQETENCSITLVNLNSNKSYQYTVSAFDAAGNESLVAAWDGITTLTGITDNINTPKTSIYSLKNAVCVDLKLSAADIEIYNILGQKVVKTHIFNGLTQIPVRESGIYIVRLKSKQYNQVQKVFVK